MCAVWCGIGHLELISLVHLSCGDVSLGGFQNLEFVLSRALVSHCWIYREILTFPGAGEDWIKIILCNHTVDPSLDSS